MEFALVSVFKVNIEKDITERVTYQKKKKDITKGVTYQKKKGHHERGYLLKKKRTS